MSPDPVVPPSRLDVLDAFRAIAVFGVFAVHFPDMIVGDLMDTGELGVRLFFVLSGFLITSLLLRDRRLIEAGSLSHGAALRGFFIRRCFRILPACYAGLAAAWLVSLDGARDSWVWHASFLSNQYVLQAGHWVGSLSHFWTLALEFQFYLAWPFAILLLPRRGLPALIALCVIAGPLARAFSPLWGAPPDFVHLVTFGSVDLFACGAALAFWRNTPGRLADHPAERLAGLLLFPLLGLSLALALKSLGPPSPVGRAVSGLVMALAFTALLAVSTRPTPPAWVRWLAGRRLLLRIGVISYGLYVYHNLMHWAAPRACLRLFGNSYPTQPFLYTGVLLVATFLAALASWHLLESPFNRLARRLTTKP